MTSETDEHFVERMTHLQQTTHDFVSVRTNDFIRLFALARRGAAIEPWNIAAANHQLRVRLLAFITRYDRDNPMRTADVHDPDCGCMRCERDRAATLLSKSPLPAPPAGETNE